MEFWGLKSIVDCRRKILSRRSVGCLKFEVESVWIDFSADVELGKWSAFADSSLSHGWRDMSSVQ